MYQIYNQNVTEIYEQRICLYLYISQNQRLYNMGRCNGKAGTGCCNFQSDESNQPVPL